MVTMLQAHLAPSSLGSYVDKFARWVHYCTETCNPTVPYLSSASLGDAQVSWEHVLAFAAHLAQTGAVQPKYLPQYVSAINSVHVALGLTPPLGKGHPMVGLVSRLAVGGTRLQRIAAGGDPGRDTTRVYGHDVLEGDHLAMLMRLAVCKLTAKDRRDLAVVFAGLLHFSRRGTLHAMEVRHVGWSDSGLRFTEMVRKGAATGNRVLFTPWAECDLALKVIRDHHDGLLSQECLGTWQLWRLPGEPGLDEATLASCVRRALHRAKCYMVEGFRVDSHMLRATAACHALAIGVPIPVVLDRGPWGSAQSLGPYMRPVITGQASHQLWGFLRGTLTGARGGPEADRRYLLARGSGVVAPAAADGVPDSTRRRGRTETLERRGVTRKRARREEPSEDEGPNMSLPHYYSTTADEDDD